MALTSLLTENLYTFHAFMAGMTGKDIWKLEEKEAADLGGAIEKVAAHYDIPGVTEKTADWIRLARVAGLTYGGRLLNLGIFSRKAVVPKADKPADAVAAVELKPSAPVQPKAPPGQVWASPGPGLPNVLMPAGG